MENQRGVVVGQCDVVASDSCHMGTDWQSEEIVGGGALLREGRKDGKMRDEEKEPQVQELMTVGSALE